MMQPSPLWFDASGKGGGALLTHFLCDVWRKNTCTEFYTPRVTGTDTIICHRADAIHIHKDDRRDDYVDPETGHFRMDHLLVNATRKWDAYLEAPWPASMEPTDAASTSHLAMEMNAFASQRARYYGVMYVHKVLFNSKLWTWFQTLLKCTAIPLDLRYHVFLSASVQCRKHMRPYMHLERLSDQLGDLLPYALDPSSHRADAAMLSLAQQKGIFPRRVCATWDEFCRETIVSVREYLQREHLPRLPDDMIGAIAQWLPFKKARYLFEAYRLDEAKRIEYAALALRARDPSISPEAVSILKSRCNDAEALFGWIRAYQRFRVSSVGRVIYVTDIERAMRQGCGYFFSQATLQRQRADVVLCHSIVSSNTVENIRFDHATFALVQNPQPPPFCRTFL